MEINIQVVPKIRKVLWVKGPRYKVLYGGRGSAKSWSVADYYSYKGAFSNERLLCTREFQSSIRDSVYRLLLDRIYFHKLEKYFKIRNDGISGIYGSEFIFKGLRQNISEVKSTEGITSCWVEEAEKVSKNSWDVLIPTIRANNSEIIVTFNPEDERSDTYTRFVEKDGKPVLFPEGECVRTHVNWWDNPWFPTALQKEMQWCRHTDPERYDHIWAGQPKKYGQSVIFKNKLRIEEFEDPDRDTTQLYYGADWGFGVDPTCLVICFIKEGKLYIWWEFYGYAIELDDLPACWEKAPWIHDWRVRADGKRPDTISHMCNRGFDVVAAEQKKGSVEDGIEFLQSFEAIVVHPRCKGSIGDFENYRWKVDKITEEVLPIPVDKSNHSPDAVRYALEPYIKNSISCWDVLPEEPMFE